MPKAALEYIMSAFGWLDYSERERRKMLDIVDLFGEHDTRDELGIGSDGTPFGTPIEPCSAVPIPRSTSSKSCFVTPKSRLRSNTAVRLWRTGGGRTAMS
jgi:hypothetical protein